MRQLAAALALFAAGTIAAPAHADSPTRSPAHGFQWHASCSVDSDYDVDVRPDGIAFTRTHGPARQLLMHDGQLQLDGHPWPVDRADAERLRQYEAQVRALLPEVAGLARDGVGIGFDALTTVAATFADRPHERERVVRQLTAQRQQVLAGIDQGIGSGHWRQHGMGRWVDDSMGQAVSTLIGTVATNAVQAAVSGDQRKVAALEARADSLDKSIERAVEAPAEKLGRRADALCPRLIALDQLQRQFSFRLPDGSPLSLVTVGQPHRDTVAETQAR
jgi:hypothetical protein